MRKTFAIFLIAVFVLGISVGHVLNNYFLQAQEREEKPASIAKTEARGPPVTPSIESSITIYLPAVDNEGKGVAMPLVVQKRGGFGETLIDINNLVFWFDTQQSIQTARAVAQNITGADLSGTNLVYTINTSATLVGGPSAGAALAIATIAALEDKMPNTSVMITGTINPDGTIGPVGGILEKAEAAKQLGAELFLVPEGQGSEISLKPEETCARRGNLVYCETRYRQVSVDISESAGIRVKEVSTVEEAEKYFFG